MAKDFSQYIQEITRLAQSDPRRFLWEIYRGGSYANLDCYLYDLLPGKVKTNWALEPADDGLKTRFNLWAGQDKSLLRAIKTYRQDFQWAEKKEGFSSRIKDEMFTPATLIKAIRQAVLLCRALDRRFQSPQSPFSGGGTVEEHCAICENVLIPLLAALPPERTMKSYPEIKPS